MESIYNIAEICSKKGLNNFVLSPGSRCAPLTVSIVNHPKLTSRTVTDERSAAFIALGLSLETQKPVGLLCTSGTAALNYAPAVAEAFYQQIPLIILTADRPPEWVDQQDGQTIRQQNIYGNHVKKFFQLPTDHQNPDSAWHIQRSISEAINLAESYPKGPVHINIPLREPFYPKNSNDVKYSAARIIEKVKAQSAVDTSDLKQLIQLFNQSEKVVLLSGQNNDNTELNTAVSIFTDHHRIPLWAEPIANLHCKNKIQNIDIILSGEPELEKLSPDLLITFGQSVLSKSLKSFLRKYKPKHHWHIDPSGEAADTYQCLSHIIPVEPKSFFSIFKGDIKNDEWLNNWITMDNKGLTILSNFFNSQSEFSEFEAAFQVTKNLSPEIILHLSNSMPVRYANYFGSFIDSGTVVRANRGTSGIDGVLSTAVGNALCTEKLVFLLTGDLAFFYDRNAFWNNYLPDNLRIVLLNNHGGGIFNMIDGPKNLKEASEYFITNQKLKADHIAGEFNLDYLHCNDRESFKAALPKLLPTSGKSKILEIETSIDNNTKVFNSFKQQIKEQFGK
ncbi:MAG: 2-succinyl-5-enolpyruvyl-6-hydroxy-3-cyclohexene-1-carboxylic-acid synthase [Sporocytophaga sp.]|uniref:2-succinyl-5-enolpyruvyl-6-hydroxy-3- cyclohexene-1-carboxylic-acid synthase n=1 Tax=Sporocytophaga sp. TaxID=2231183 RepID=UPI001B2044AD|nr:2-succinyl-5-enolpyruvyl-6-hydroxy-3-cyclohexene-1-carboxylic-acid synthase [Sporocytophaga sp.]MBO9702479.1 2-succinyl-5-enolpyruvyl-6-hydroxy-3-cyclohexene-1-carboxylic-acid synthase [Sporocytophaga sp.]